MIAQQFDKVLYIPIPNRGDAVIILPYTGNPTVGEFAEHISTGAIPMQYYRELVWGAKRLFHVQIIPARIIPNLGWLVSIESDTRIEPAMANDLIIQPMLVGEE